MMRIKRWLWGLMALLCLWLPVASAEEAISFQAILPARNGQAEVLSVYLETEQSQAHWLFLPSFADLNNVCIHSDAQGLMWPWGEAFESGQAVDVPKQFALSEDGVYTAELARGDETIRLSVMRSANLRTMFFMSDDPANHGRAWIEACERHENETTGSMALVDVNGVVDHAAKVSNWRGRGNTTWDYDKKPYQLKLEYKADLLKTGIPAEMSRTWVLLSNAMDLPFLRDKIALDLGLELGMTETSRSEYIDLYYDGEYLGIFLLCEKVEVQKGRVEIGDYDELIKSWNAAAGQYDLDVLPVGENVNVYGLPYTYTEGLIEAEDPSVGAYMVEMENSFTLTDKCYFKLGDGGTVAMKNPEYASSAMVAYISEKLETARRALVNHGVDPETGTKATDVFDVDAFARIALINEFSYNRDGFAASSSWFLLPEGGERFRPGPAWDFTLAFLEIKETGSDGVSGFKPTGWLQLFYGVPEFRAAIQRICEEEFYGYVQEILLGEKKGSFLRPIDEYVNQIETAMDMNQRLWSVTGWAVRMPLKEQAKWMKEYISGRMAWLYPRIMAWEIDTAETVELQATTKYLMLEEGFNVQVPRWINARMTDWQLEQIEEATEENYALWQFSAQLEPLGESAFSETTRAFFNEKEVPCELGSDGTLSVTVLLEDPSYKPVYAYDEDIGLVYNHDYYTQKYPEVAEECENDPMLMAEYFYDYGMDEIHLGNAFFNPRALRKKLPELADEYGDMWSSYYWDFIDMRYEEWLPYVAEAYVPEALEMEQTLEILNDGN